MLLALEVALAAGVGAVVRYAVDVAVQQRAGGEFPYGTLAINLAGAFVLGLVIGLGAHHGLPTTAVVVVGSGLAGGASTLSTWAWETLALARGGAVLEAIVNVVATFGLGVAAAAAGFGVALL